MYLYVKKVRRRGKTYRYLVIEQYVPGRETRDGKPRKLLLASIPMDEAIRLILWAMAEKGWGKWCGGRDLNPRRPTPADLESAPLVQARAPPLRPENDLEGTRSISISPRRG